MLTEVDAFRQAGNRDDARDALLPLVRLAVEDAVAVSPHAGDVVAAVRLMVEEGVPWRADAFAVLLYVLDHADVWHNLRKFARTYQGEYDESIAWEDAVFRALAGFDLLVRNLIVDPDPETRSIACLLLGWISTEPEADLALLRMLGSLEPDDRVRACVGVSVVRLGGTTAEATAQLNDEAPVVRQRLARFLLPSRHSPDPTGVDPAVTARARVVLTEEPANWRWLAEEI
ncbi:MAG: hypothetical protein ABW046_02845 [Actinoplanes sp.]